MLVFNEGVPRSGKSYDAVKTHILPALKAGRRVYARLNGLNHEKIAAYLKIPLEQVQALLIHVETRDVVKTFQAVPPASRYEKDAAGSWSIPDDMKNALFVIDEVHEFYVTGRQPLAEPVEQFFALHGQNGMDGVIMTQAYKRLHAVIRARIERKNQFQKLTAVGLKSRYRVSYFTTIAPDRYERVGGQTLKYDPDIFPLYAGYAVGATNTEVYESGGRTVWAKLARPLIIAAVILGFAIPVVNRFMHGDVKLTKTPTTPAYMTPPAKAGSAPAPLSAEKAAPTKSAVLPTSHHGAYDTEGMPPEVAYVFEISQQARPRVAAVLESSWRGVVGVVEWREDQGHVLDSMSFDELRSMGVQVNVRPYGVRIEWKKQVIVATRWPVDMPGAIPQDARSAASAAPAFAPPTEREPVQSRDSGSSKHKWGERDTGNAYVPPQLTNVSAIGG
ncbi:zonular occludens toxin domain-containing protein [Xanthomonas sp. NCPPB 2632]|uniref:zonular occludens toxin domain-containing protein n=1 Tax=Xanthomonas sp. NCPPB 2632 TaxID=3240912 RepID=UPI0035197209